MNSFRPVIARLCLVFIGVLFPAGLALADNLSPPRRPPIAETDDRRIKETELDAKSFDQALQFLRQGLPRALDENVTTEDLRRREGFAIGYPNFVMTIE